MTFAAPLWLAGLLGLLPLAYAAWRLERGAAGARSATAALPGGSPSRRSAWVPGLLWGLRLLAVGGLLVALARPQGAPVAESEAHLGVDVMIALDVSGSMRAEDFQPENRLTAAKAVIGQFIRTLEGHRAGLVIFAGRSLTAAPLSTDREMVEVALRAVDFGSVRQDGTAIGDAIGNALYRLTGPAPRGKVIVLFTDGEQNAGYLGAEQAALLARTRGVRIHTVAVGRPGGAPIPIVNAWGQKVYLQNAEGRLILPPMDEAVLRRIAELTGGRAFRATDTEALRRVLAEIDRMEKRPLEARGAARRAELFGWPALGAALALALALGLGTTRWRVAFGATP